MSVLDRNQWELLLAIAHRVVPATAVLDADQEEAFRAVIEGALAQRPPEIRKQFATLLKVIRLAPVLRYGRSFDRLPAERQDAVLRWFEDAPFLVLRKGLWGLKAMVFMGYYGRPEGAAEVGYTPEFDGNARLAAARAQGGGR
jgi:hypothetical protein